MAVKIQVRRGSRAGLPALAPGEYGLTTDTKELFIGGPDGNLQVPVLGSDGKVPAGQLPDMNYDPAGTAATEAGKVQANLTSHTNNKSNPHSVTKAQVVFMTSKLKLETSTDNIDPILDEAQKIITSFEDDCVIAGR